MAIALKHRKSINRGRNQNQGTILVDHVEQFTLLKRASTDEISRLKELFYGLFCHADKKQKRRISIALSRNVYTPRSILIFLGLEKIDIASPVLLFSPVLSEKDLRNIIEKRSFEHARVVARRDNIELRTIQLLLEKDDENETVLKILRQNLSIRETLSTTRKRTKRNKVKESAVKKFASPVPAPTIIKIATAPDTEQKDLTESLVALANKGNRLRQRKRHSLSASRPDHTQRLGGELILAARTGQPEKLSEAIYYACNLEPELTLKYVAEKDIGTFACLLFALEVTKLTAGRIMLLLFPVLGQNKAVFSEVMNHYESLEREKVVSFFITHGAQFHGVNKPGNIEAPKPETFDALLRNRRQSVQNTHSQHHDIGKTDIKKLART
ncbi:MAG: hypothetical protein AAGA76_04220 [Pseudomonadota bacterium]